MGKGGGEKGGEKGKGKPTGKGGKGKKGDAANAQKEWDASTEEGELEAPSTGDSNAKGKGDGKGKSGKGKEGKGKNGKEGNGKEGKGKKGKGPGKGLPNPEEVERLVDDAMNQPDEIFEDALREALQEQRRLDYPEMPVQVVFDVVHPSIRPAFHNVVQGLSGRISDFEGKCGQAEKRQRAWIKERHRLGEEVEALQRKFNEERARAAQNSAVAANNSLRLLTGGQIPKGHLNAIKVVGAGGLDVNIQHLEKDIGKLDIDLGTTRFKTLQSIINTIYWRFLPQTRATKYIASHYGEACGAFFRFHSTLLLISVITLACYAPLLIMQVMDYYEQLGQNWCGSSAYIKIPCEFLFGGFRGVNSSMVENWTTAVHVSVSATGEYELKSDLGADFFDAEMAQCPVLRQVRDCRVHSLYAGYMANSSAPRPYDLFTSNWSTSPYEMNKDYVIMSNYASLLNSAPTWRCTGAAVAGVGFPSDCGSEYGSFGEAATVWQDWFALPGNSSQDLRGVSFGAALEVFSGTRCPVQQQADIEDLAAGRKRSQEPSGRDVWLAIRYFSCTFGGALCVVIFVIIRWKSAEVTFSIEHSVEEVSPIRWSRWVLGLRDFRLGTTEEKQLWGQALANLLRAEYEAETHAEREGAKKGWQRWLVTFKRVIGATLNITIIFGSWVAIAYSFVEQTTIQSFLNSLTQQEPLRSVLATIGAFAPNLVIAAAGQVLPFMTKTLTDFEAWEPAARARHNLWRLFFGKVLNATVFIALNVELLNDKPMLLKNRFLATRDCVNFVCAEDQAGMQVVSLTNSARVLHAEAIHQARSCSFPSLLRGFALAYLQETHGRPWTAREATISMADVRHCRSCCGHCLCPAPHLDYTALHALRSCADTSRSVAPLPMALFPAEASHVSAVRLGLLETSSSLAAGALLWGDALLHRGLVLPHVFLSTRARLRPLRLAPGHMIFDLEFGFRTQLAEIMSFVTRIWMIILLVLVFMVFMLWLRMIVARRTNLKVLDTLAATSQRQVENLYKEMMRLEQKADNYRKRIEWIEKHHKNK